MKYLETYSAPELQEQPLAPQKMLCVSDWNDASINDHEVNIMGSL